MGGRSGVSVLTAAAVVLAALAAPVGDEAVSAAPAGSSRFVATGPERVMDTRDSTGVAAGLRRPGSSTVLKVAGADGVPANATAVVLNATITQSVKAGYVQLFPTGEGTPGASSNLNVPGPGVTIANLVIVPVGANGRVTFFNHAGGHLLADLFGYFVGADSSSAGRFIGLDAPVRELDTRVPRKVPIIDPGDVKNCGDFSTWDQANRWFWTYRRHCRSGQAGRQRRRCAVRVAEGERRGCGRAGRVVQVEGQGHLPAAGADGRLARWRGAPSGGDRGGDERHRHGGHEPGIPAGVQRGG
jgi:hypothetical protein